MVTPRMTLLTEYYCNPDAIPGQNRGRLAKPVMCRRLRFDAVNKALNDKPFTITKLSERADWPTKFSEDDDRTADDVLRSKLFYADGAMGIKDKW